MTGRTMIRRMKRKFTGIIRIKNTPINGERTMRRGIIKIMTSIRTTKATTMSRDSVMANCSLGCVIEPDSSSSGGPGTD